MCTLRLDERKGVRYDVWIQLQAKALDVNTDVDFLSEKSEFFDFCLIVCYDSLAEPS